MLTPAFDINQDSTSITIIIKAALAKISETEIFIEEDEFRFYSSPYFLRLTLPGKIVEDGTETAKYDSDQGSFIVKVSKQTPGENFIGLDLLTKLLAPKRTSTINPPLIEVLQSDDLHPSNNDESDDEFDEDFDWQIDQSPAPTTPIILSRDQFGYGFANQRTGILTPRIMEEYHEALDLKEPEITSPLERRNLRIEDENEQFDPEYYLADLYGNDHIQACLQYDAEWSLQYEHLTRGHDPNKLVQFSDDEKEQMRTLPKKEYILSGDMKTCVYLGLVDLLFAYVYDKRTTEGESSVESGWTIRKLSSSLSWFESFRRLDEVVVASMRRSLCYPLYRHWSLSQMLLHDTLHILKLGKRRILQCLLDMRSLLRERDPCFILNHLYIDDYCVWIQYASDKKINSLSDALSQLEMTKSAVGLDLEELEEAAELAVQCGIDKSESGESESDSESESESNFDTKSESDYDSMSKSESRNPENSVTNDILSSNLESLTLSENPTVDNITIRSACGPLVEEL